MHAELTMNVTNEAPSSTHEWRADRDGESSICLLSLALDFYLLEPFHWMCPGPNAARVVERLSSDCDDHLNCRQSRQILWPSSMGMEQHHAAHSVWFVLAVFCSTSSAPSQTVSQLLPATPIRERV